MREHRDIPGFVSGVDLSGERHRKLLKPGQLDETVLAGQRPKISAYRILVRPHRGNSRRYSVAYCCTYYCANSARYSWLGISRMAQKTCALAGPTGSSRALLTALGHFQQLTSREFSAEKIYGWGGAES